MTFHWFGLPTIRVRLLPALALLAISACSKGFTMVEVDFRAGAEVSRVRLLDETRTDNTVTVALNTMTDGACDAQSRGTYIIRFDEDTERTELSLKAIPLNDLDQAIGGIAEVWEKTITLSSGDSVSEVVSFCPNSPRMDSGVSDAAEINDASERVDAGAIGDAGVTQEAGTVDRDSGASSDSGAISDTGSESDAGAVSVDAATPDSGQHPDAQVIPMMVCGDGRLDMGEACDDGNTANGDGCSAMCTTESSWRCATPPRGRSQCHRSGDVGLLSSGGDFSQVMSDHDVVFVRGNPLAPTVIQLSSAYDVQDSNETILADGGEVILTRSGGFRTVFEIEDGKGLTLIGVTVVGKIDHKGGALEVYDSILRGHDSMANSSSAQEQVIHFHESGHQRLVVARSVVMGGKREGIRINSRSGYVEITNNIFYGNGFGYSNGLAINLQELPSSTRNIIAFNTFAENGDGSSTTGISCQNSANRFVLRSNLFWNSFAQAHTIGCCHQDTAYGSPTNQAGDLSNQTNCLGNSRSINPGSGQTPFVSIANQDYHLSFTGSNLAGMESLSTSPAVLDFDSQVRISSAGTGSTYRGADHYTP